MIDFFSYLLRIGAESFLRSQMYDCKIFICNMKLNCTKTNLSEKYGICTLYIEAISNIDWEMMIHTKGPILNKTNVTSSIDLVFSNAL